MPDGPIFKRDLTDDEVRNLVARLVQSAGGSIQIPEKLLKSPAPRLVRIDYPTNGGVQFLTEPRNG